MEAGSVADPGWRLLMQGLQGAAAAPQLPSAVAPRSQDLQGRHSPRWHVIVKLASGIARRWLPFPGVASGSKPAAIARRVVVEASVLTGIVLNIIDLDLAALGYLGPRFDRSGFDSCRNLATFHFIKEIRENSIS